MIAEVAKHMMAQEGQERGWTITPCASLDCISILAMKPPSHEHQQQAMIVVLPYMAIRTIDDPNEIMRLVQRAWNEAEGRAKEGHP